MSDTTLKINEIFYSIQGESLFVGKPTVFIRTATCNLRCRWCDTQYSFWNMKLMTVQEILAAIEKFPTRYVCVTGGEPLGQKAALPLLKLLVEKGYTVSLETNGSFSVEEVPKEVIKVIDIKCPESGESESMDWKNIDRVSVQDQFKFAVGSKADFDWAQKVCEENRLASRCSLLVSPIYGRVQPKELAEWVLESPQPFTLQIQLHKEIWGAGARGV